MTAGKTRLERRLIERIRREGPVSFRDFMQAALYDAEFGYYNTARLKIGASGDYYTSGNVHQAFGRILARVFVELWQQLGEADHFALAEMGAGTGRLAFDILQALREEHPCSFAALRYTIIEQSPMMRQLQKAMLNEFAEKLVWRDLHELEREPLTGIFFSNELLDAFPVHCVRYSPKGSEELFVTLSSAPEQDAADKNVADAAKERLAGQPEQLVFIWQEAANPQLADYMKRTGVRLTENQKIEINLDAIGWLKTLSAAITKGFLVTIDYGDVAAHLYAQDRREGTLRCFYKHTLTERMLQRIGEQDITASINFSALMDFGKEFGFETVSYERQTRFLFRHGLIERIAAMEEADTLENLQDRLAIKNLLAPGGISDNFRVLIQKKSLE